MVCLRVMESNVNFVGCNYFMAERRLLFKTFLALAGVLSRMVIGIGHAQWRALLRFERWLRNANKL
jgi:hypothetical protein